MKKIFISFIGSFVFIFFVWTIVAWITIPDFIENSSHYHLDLYQMLDRFNYGESANQNFISIFQSFIKSMSYLNHTEPVMSGIANAFTGGGYEFTGGWQVVLGLLNAAINPFYQIANITLVIGYVVVLAVQIFEIITVLLTALFDFVFNPVFIYL